MGRIYPNIYIADVNVGGKLPSEAVSLLSEKINSPTKINLIAQGKPYELKTGDFDLNYELSSSVARAYNLTRNGNFLFDSYKRLELIYKPYNMGLSTKIDSEKLSVLIKNLDDLVNIKPVYPSVSETNGIIQVVKGSPGYQIDKELLRAKIGHNLSYVDLKDVQIPVITVDPTLNTEQISTAKIRGEKLVGKSLTLKFNTNTFDYNQDDILKFVNPTGGYSDQDINYAISKIATAINSDPQNAKFEFNGAKVSVFQEALDGITLDNQKLKNLLTSKLDDLSNSADKNISFDIPVIKTPPEVSTAQVNNLGIKELIGRGTSTYFHSIPGRVFNVNLAASRINGTLVKPGDTFSFNQTLGDVSKFTGYQQAYIISGGHTILGDGGGVCQVSTTLFRAALNVGLPIEERTAHAYRVGYYEQNSPPGIDATVYEPSPDFKFKNDTPAYILIQAKNDSANYSLVFEIYGTSDGRISKITKPIISNVIPPLPDVYQDNPTIPAGTVKQTDFAAWGAKIVFDYSVERAGQQIYQKTFVSNYQPWAAAYLRGTKI